MTAPLVLGIETSCDETGAGLVRGRELLADSVASSGVAARYSSALLPGTLGSQFDSGGRRRYCSELALGRVEC